MTLDQAKKQLREFIGDGALTFSVTYSENGNEWVAQCNEVDGIITCGTGDDMANMEYLMQDAILTAAGIPRELSEELLRHVKRVWAPNQTSAQIPAYPFPIRYSLNNGYAALGKI